MPDVVEITPIGSFAGPHRFLSNFHPARVTINVGDEVVVAPTVEHAYQAAKTADPEERRAVLAASTPGMAKRLGRRVTIMQSWPEARHWVMLCLLREKFLDPGLAEALVATRPRALIEGNRWHDTYWGTCTCGRASCQGAGQNHLGQLLMRVREDMWRAFR